VAVAAERDGGNPMSKSPYMVLVEDIIEHRAEYAEQLRQNLSARNPMFDRLLKAEIVRTSTADVAVSDG
jgi:hypothetical protein